MFLDNKGRLFGKINIIDLTAFLAIIAILAATGMYFYKVNAQRTLNKPGDDKLIVYDIELKGLTQEVLNSVKAGDRITDDVKYVSMGVIKEIKDKKANEDLRENNVDGTYFYGHSLDQFQATATIESKAKMTKDTLKIGEFDIKIGKYMSIKGKDYVVSGYITSIRNHN